MSKKVRIRKPGTTLSMRIAKSHDTSKQMNGWIGANGYKFAIALSVIGTTIGLNLGFISHFSTVPAWEILIVGIPFAAILSTLIELTALSSIKRAKAIGVTLANFKLLWPQYMAVGVGVALSSVSGDQMYSLAFTGNDAWKAWMFACVVSFCLIMTEIYAKEHEVGIEESVRRSGVTKIAQEEEISEHLEKIEREQRLELLQEPEFAQEIREGQRLWLNQLSAARRTEMIQRVQIVESDLQQLPAPQDVKLLPEPSVKAEPRQDVQIKPLSFTNPITNPINSKFVTGFLQRVNQLPEPINTQDVNEHDDATEIEHVENVNALRSNDTLEPQIESSQIHTDDIPVNVDPDEPTIEAKRSATLRLLHAIVSPQNTEDEDVNVDLPKAEPDTNPLPKLRTPKTAKRVTKKYADGLDPIVASKIVKAQTKLTSRGLSTTHQAIADEAGIKSRQTVSKYLRAMAKAESEV